jgi:hypothetical protein
VVAHIHLFVVAEVAGRIQFFEVVAEVADHIQFFEVVADVADHIQFFEVVAEVAGRIQFFEVVAEVADHTHLFVAVDILYYVVVMAEAHYFVPVLLEEPNEYTSLVAVEVYEQDQMELLELEFVC